MGRDFSVASTMTNPFLVQAAESCAEERAVAVCEAQVDQEAVEVNPFAALSRSKSGNGFVSRRPTEVEVSKAAFDVEEGGSSSDGRCCSLSCCASQPQICQLCLYSLCATLIIGTGALAYYFVREHHHQ